MELIVFLMNALVTTFLEWLNTRIRLEEGHRESFDEVAFYRFLSMLLFSHISAMSEEATYV